ncbi:hypothetical protein ACFVVM_31935 [Nocardia sp. NPDC058176]|uniref:hypothetical protein n=1 Tax=Nocardia sp. NPDC058176 TaxID=3346368 RepID=UPI0036D9B1D6
MRRALGAVALFLTVGLFLPGCGGALTGTPIPEGARYRGALVDHLGKPVKGPDASMTEQDAARRIDPCALLDPAAVSALGTVRYSGPGDTLGDCEILIGADRTTPVTKVSLSMAVMPVFTGATTTIGSRTGSEIPGEGLCSIAVAYNDRRAMNYTAHSDGTGSPCPALRTLVAASVPLLDSPGERAKPLRDPCSFLDVMYPAEQTFALIALNPSTCDYSLGPRVRDDHNRYVVRTMTMSKLQLDHPRPGARQLRVAGVPATEYPSGENYCIIDAFAGIDQPYLRPGWGDESEEYVEVLSVSGRDCEVVRDITVAAVRTYQAD